MTTSAGNAVVPRKRRRLVLAVVLLTVVGLAAGLGWRAWRRHTAPLPPEVPLAEAEPAVAEALREARRQIEKSPSSVEAWGRLGKLLRACDFQDEAAVCFGRVAHLDPGNPRWPYLQGEALLQRQPEAALPHLRRAVELCTQPDDAFAPRLRLAEALLATGQNEEAEAQLHLALQAEPDHPCVHLDLALAAYARDNLPGCRTHLLRCQHSPFTRKKACSLLAAVEQRQGNDAAASQFSQGAAALDADVHWSDPWLLEAQQLAPGKPGRFRYVEQLEAHEHFQEAVTVLRQLLNDGPDYRVLVGLGKDLTRLGDYAGAAEALEKAIRLIPENVQAHYYLAKVLWTQAEQARARGDRERARSLYTAATESARLAVGCKPDHALAQMILGLCLKELGRREEALEALARAVACAPELPDPSLHLGEALAEAGRTAEARPHLENALRLARPGDDRARAALARLSGTSSK
jgi:tetratricopeptide (TPR) repeat protein